MKAVAFEFESMYPEADRSQRFTVFEKEKEIPEIAKGVEELMVCGSLRTKIILSDKIQSDDWIYCQTPQFTFSTENVALSVIGQRTKSSWPSMWSGVSFLQ
jgi:lipoate-protein ligase A